jgi:hypothetical protein
MTSRLWRYALYQLRDYATGVGGATLILGVLGVLVLSGITINGMAVSSVAALQQSTVAFIFGVLGFVGPVMALSGLVADDRARGFYRFIFAGPVSPPRYYGQAYVVRGVGLLVIAALVWLVAMWRITTVSLVGVLAFTALCYLTVGGVTLLFSAVGRFAWLVVGLLWCVGWGAVAGSVVGSTWSIVWQAVHVVVPPFQLLNAIDRSLISHVYMGMQGPQPLTDLTGASASTYLWFAGYGVATLVAAWAVLRGREWN